MTTTKTYVAPSSNIKASNGGGFVKGVVTYMVTDALVIKPLSTIESITLLNKLNVQKLSALEVRVVNLTMNEALMLLKASLYTDKVLTEVFVKGQINTTAAA
ncbi:uncharacterized protein [Henckelia pumila]|uniref:uncharacterized protein n=1 Tax=Henckelia pumila TaxID=405737 RepID=UPI003C6E709F